MEHVVFCIDNSAWSRNGDYAPTRIDVQLNLIYDFYPVLLDANPENTMGIISMGGNRVTVLTSLTRERYKFGASMKDIEKKGECDLYRGLAMAQLVLKHRENTNGQTRIIVFVGSPIKRDPKLLNLALLLSKDSISVDIVSFGEISDNHDILEEFISKVNLDNNSHLYEVTPRQSFNEILLPQGGDNGFDDFDADPDLLRAIEESKRSYQMENANKGITTEESLGNNDFSELQGAFDGADLDEDYMNQLRMAMMESLRDSNENDKKEDNDKKDDKDEVD